MTPQRVGEDAYGTTGGPHVLDFPTVDPVVDGSPAHAHVRAGLKNGKGLSIGDHIILSGADTPSGRGLQLDAQIVSLSTTSGHVTLQTTAAGFVMRPERLTAAALYNPRVAELFVAFARKYGLYVAWLGCQNDKAVCPETPVAKPKCRQKER